MPANIAGSPAKIGANIFTLHGIRVCMASGCVLVERKRFALPPYQCNRTLLTQRKFQDRAARLAAEGFIPCFDLEKQAIIVYELKPKKQKRS